MQPVDTVLSPKWYEGLRKPSWTPPPWAFPLAWIPLKLLQTIAAAMIWETEEARVFSSPAVLLFVVHLALGDVWNIQFFAKQRLLTGLLTIVAFWLMLGSATVAFCVANPVAGALLGCAALGASLWFYKNQHSHKQEHVVQQINEQGGAYVQMDS